MQRNIINLVISTVLVIVFSIDLVYSHFNPNNGDGITSSVSLNINDKTLIKRVC